jgi:hypothetical protein
VPPSSSDIPTASTSFQDQDQPTHEESDDMLNDYQGQVDGQDGDQNDQDDQVILKVQMRRSKPIARE